MASEGVKRRLSAILSADVVGYSRLMEEDEERTVRTMESYRETVGSLVQQHNGRIVDSPGDNTLSEFASVVDAVLCAVEIQHVIKAKNAAVPEARRMQFRIGISLEDVIEEKGRIYGDGVNIASRIEGLADAGGVCISGRAYDHIANKLALGYEGIGEHTVKNISMPVQVYRIAMDSTVSDAGARKRGVRRFQWAAMVLIAFAVGIGAVTAWNRYLKPSPSEEAPRQETAIPPAEKPSIAVLPFDNMSSDPEQEYFVDGMTEEVISRLAMNPALTVIARNSTFTYKGKAVKVQQVGLELGVKHVLEGSVRKAGPRIRVTAQLVDATTGGHLWTNTYDRDLKDVFAVQSEVAQEIAVALGAEYGEMELERVKRIPTENLTAYESLVRGSELQGKLTKEANAQARELFEGAIKLDPVYAHAIAALGSSYWLDYVMAWNSDPRILDQAYELAQEASALDRASAHYLLARIHSAKREFGRALAEAQRALELYPNGALVHFLMGEILIGSGKPEMAVEVLEKAIRLNPKHGGAYLTALARSYRLTGRNEDAISVLEKGLSINPDWMAAYTGLASSYSIAGRNEEAIQILERAISVDPDWPVAYHDLGLIYRNTGRREKAIEAFRNAVSIDPSYVHAYGGLGDTYGMMSRHEEAIEAFGKAISIDPSYVRAYARLGDTYRLMDRHEEAIEAFRKAISIDPSYVRAYARLGDTYGMMDRHEEAIAEYEKALARDANYAHAYRRLGHAYRSLGQYEKAIAAYQEAISKNPDSVLVYGWLGSAYHNVSRYSDAIEVFKQSIARHPDHLYGYIGLGHTYSAMGRFEDAIEEYQKVLMRDPNNRPANRGLAGVHLRQWIVQKSHNQETLEQSVEILQRALSAAGPNATTHAWLARLRIW